MRKGCSSSITSHILPGYNFMIWDKTRDILTSVYLLSSPGEIVGPVVGGALYEIGGFTLPFAVMGSILALSSLFIYFVLPETPEPPAPEPVE